MITAIDTNILIDIFGADPKFGEKSSQAVRKCMQEGALSACEVVWVETATVFTDQNEFQQAMELLDIRFSPLTLEASLIAAQTWQQYRKAGGTRSRVVADFLIGAHALTSCARLLTRERGFFRKYFDSLLIFDPSDV